MIRNLEPHTPLQIRVLCPRGHFISDTTLSVIDGQLTMQGERSGYDKRRRALQNKPQEVESVAPAANQRQLSWSACHSRVPGVS